MRRRVLWVIKGLGPGGAERLLAEAAAALTTDELTLSCAYVVPAKQHLVPQLQAAGVECTCVGRGVHDVWWTVRLARLVRRGRFDVVHVHSPLPGSVARVAARTMPRSRRPVLLTTEHNSRATYRLPTRLLNRWTSRWDTHTFAVSAEVAASVPGHKAAVLPHGVDIEQVRPHLGSRERMRAQLGVGDSTVLLGTVANFRVQKDYPNLLRACALLVDQGVQFRLVAVGQGPQEAVIRVLHAQLGLGKHVTLLGYRADALDVLAACDVFVLASRFEGLPVALMDASALGLPCVLTDVGGMRAAMGADGARWVSPGEPLQLADALAEVIASPVERQRLGYAAAVAAPTFDGALAVAVLRRWYLAGEKPVGSIGATVGATDETGVVIRRATHDDLPEILSLCRRSLGWDGEGDWEGLYRWKHFDNPFGESPTWVAVADGRLVGLRVFLRWEFCRDHNLLTTVRAVDTATDAAFRGQGLFTMLTAGALPALRDEGVEMVFNTPNEQSRPGYLKMGWREVGALRPVLRPVGVRGLARVMRSRVPASLWPEPVAIGRSVEEWLAADGGVALAAAPAVGGIRTRLDEPFVRWRFGSPLQPCRIVGADDTVAVVQVRARGKARELVCLASIGDAADIDRLLVVAAREATADVVLRLGAPALLRGFIGIRALGPRLTCRMLVDEPGPALREWQLTMGDVALF